MRRLIAAAALLALVLTGCGRSGREPAPRPESEPAVSALAPEPAPLPEPEPVPQAPTREELARAVAEGMTAEELTGQLFFVRSPGDTSLGAQWVEEYHLGGMILFGRDFKENTPDGVRQRLEAWQQSAEVPLLIAVDEEGGSVVRASYYPAFRAEKFASPQKIFARGGMEAVRADALEKSTFLKELGINVNLAPVCDVSVDPNDFIYSRAFGQGAEETAVYAETVVAAMGERGMGSVLKHFPGYGNNADTHTGIAVDPRPLENFLTQDLLPFAAGVRAGAGGVLVSHNIITCLDETLPASLSPAVYRLLREETGFAGVAMTDDMDMGAVAQYVSEGCAVVTALNAGADMVLTSSPQTQIPQVLEGLEKGLVSRRRLEEAAARVLLWKADLGLLSL